MSMIGGRRNQPWLTSPDAPRQQMRQVSQTERYAVALRGLEKSQWWDPGRLFSYQFHLLRQVLAHAYQNVAHYRESFDLMGLTPDQITPANWHRVPILTRAVLQEREILSDKVPAQHGQVFSNKTSGSTGQPVKIYATELTNFYFLLLNIRDCLWHRRDMTRKHASIKFFPEDSSPEGRSFPSWGPPIDALYGRGPLVMLDIRHPVKHQLEWLVDHNPEYLLTYPSNLKALVEESLKVGLELPCLKEVRTISEILTPEVRTFCSETWGIPLTDIYSSQEFGYIALRCPSHDHYHVQAENVLLEVLDDDGRLCQPGEIGRVVLTSLVNYATPLIRYEIRDYAEVGPPCECGRGLPVIKRIIGRQRNMMTLPSGEKRWPMLGWSRYKEVAPIKQFQFIQHTPTRIEMRLVSDQKLSTEQQCRLKEILQDSLGYPFEFVLTETAEIPQGANGKYEEFLSRVGEGP